VAINLATRRVVRLPDDTRDFFQYFEPKPVRWALRRWVSGRAAAARTGVLLLGA
jgi:hypothetical protein